MGLQLCYSQWAVNQIKKSTCTNSLFSVLLSWEPLLPLMPRLMLMPTTAITTPPCTTPTPTGPVSQLPSHPPPVSAAVARGPLMLRLMPMATTPTTVPSTTPVLPDTPEPLPLSSPDLPRDLARGPLMPMLMLTTATTDTVTVMVIMVDTEVTTDIPMDT